MEGNGCFHYKVSGVGWGVGAKPGKSLKVLLWLAGNPADIRTEYQISRYSIWCSFFFANSPFQSRLPTKTFYSFLIAAVRAAWLNARH
jgi:hypothetical protein